MDNRLAAKEWAADIMKTLHIPNADRPYVQAVLVEAALFEDPVKELAIGVNQVGDFYMITIKGYENMIDLVKWVNLFMSRDRDDRLCRVTHTFLQMPPNEGALLAIQMEKVNFHTARETSALATGTGTRRIRKKRTE